MLKNLPSGVVEGRVEEVTVEAIIDRIFKMSVEFFRSGETLPYEIWFSVQEGNEIALSDEFPNPELLAKAGRIIRGAKMGDVSVHLHSWEDPACEVEQGAWCIGIKLQS